jgi:hypothetical protein
MTRKTDEHWGTLLLEMAEDARQDGDVGTADLLTGAAMAYFDGSDSLVRRWRNFEARADGEHLRRRSA